MSERPRKNEQNVLRNLKKRLHIVRGGSPVAQLLAPTPAAEKYRQLCAKTGRKPNEGFAHSLQIRVFDLDVTRLEHEGPEDLLGTYLKVLTCTRDWNYVRIVDRKPGSVGVNSKSGPLMTKHVMMVVKNKQAIGNRIVVALSKLKRSKTIEKLDLKGLRVPKWSDVAKTIGRFSNLKELLIHKCRMGDVGLKALTVGLRRSSLNKLRVSDCGLTSKSGTAIAALLRCHAARRIELRWRNDLRIKKEEDRVRKDEWVRYDTAGNGLTAVDLSYNQLGDAGTKHICEALEDDEWFLYLDLKQNHIGKKGMAAVLSALQSNPGLAHVGMAENLKIPAEIVREAGQLMNERFLALPDHMQKLTMRWTPDAEEPAHHAPPTTRLSRRRRPTVRGRGASASSRKRPSERRPNSAPPVPRRQSRTTFVSPERIPTARRMPVDNHSLVALQSQREDLDTIVQTLGQLGPQLTHGDQSKTVMQLVDYLSSAFQKLDVYLDKLESPTGGDEQDPQLPLTFLVQPGDS